MERFSSRTFCLCLLLLTFTGIEGQQSQCQNGWFGDKCQYQCHCLNNAVCDKVTGECPGDCDRRWFGPQCQYSDAAYNTNSLLTDGIESTCLVGNGLSQDFPMSYNVMLTWMRFVTNRPGLFDHDHMNITFRSSSGAEVAQQPPLRKIYFGDTILYVYGELQDRFNTIRLSFDTPETRQSFCSMQVSSGRNVAIKQNTSQSSTWADGVAERAVDGKSFQRWDEGSCTSTRGVDDSPYWTVNLSVPVIVNKYTVVGRTDVSALCRLRYFRLESYFESTQVQQYDERDLLDQLSYDVYPVDTSPITSVKLTVSKYFWPGQQYGCNNGNPSLSFCEMEIYGDVVCAQGKWGRDCENNCNCQDPNDSCYVSTGMCPSGCKSGFHGPGCKKECADGRWGVDCLNRCDYCLVGNCTKSSGACLSQCVVPGYKMSFCIEECDTGLHGYNCNQTCPKNCLNNVCDNVNGTCINCVAGYQGPECNQECADGQWGISCLNQCGNCLNGKCSKVSGECPSGCDQGYKMPLCTQECDVGFHGYSCKDNCPENCRNNICDNVDGLCIKCKAGYQGTLCAEECDATFFGEDCATPCSDTCIDQLCHHITGVCKNCPHGKQISKNCSQDCDPGSHGYGCFQPCPEHCQDKICDNVDGTCTKCVAGYQGPVCNIECDSKFYGENCAAQCSEMCIDQLCNHITGVCNKCPDGKQISKDCSQDVEEFNLVLIVAPIAGAVFIVIAALIIGICLCRRRNQKARIEKNPDDKGANGPPTFHMPETHRELKDLPSNEQVPVMRKKSPNLNQDNQAVTGYDNTRAYVNVNSHLYSETEEGY